MARETETYTKTVERTKDVYKCDGKNCGYTFGHSLTGANIIIANAEPEDGNQRITFYGHPVTDDYLTSYHDSNNGIKAEGELHLCDNCYAEISPIFTGEEESDGTGDSVDTESNEDIDTRGSDALSLLKRFF